MSTTPRTDAATKCGNTHPDYVHAEFARELERNLQESNKSIALLAQQLADKHPKRNPDDMLDKRLAEFERLKGDPKP